MLSPCHTNADCNNTVGNYTCNCKAGFEGDGKISCTGKQSKLLPLQGFCCYQLVPTSLAFHTVIEHTTAIYTFKHDA